MTINIFTNGTPADADEVNSNFNQVNNICAQDQTGGSHTGSTSETMIGEVILTGGTAINGVIVVATGTAQGNVAGDATATLKLYSGTNAAFGSNSVRKTITRVVDDTAYSHISWTIVYVLSSEETWSGDVYLQITGENDRTQISVTCESVVVLPIGGAV